LNLAGEVRIGRQGFETGAAFLVQHVARA
jgi:hypothetical protein